MGHAAFQQLAAIHALTSLDAKLIDAYDRLVAELAGVVSDVDAAVTTAPSLDAV